MSARLTLTHEGEVFLNRWGWEWSWSGIFLHHVAGPDPGLDLHDHPWPFISIRLHGGYVERIADIRVPGRVVFASRLNGRVHFFPLRRIHRITRVLPNTWTIVIHGRKQPPPPLILASDGRWGYYNNETRAWEPHGKYPYERRRPIGVPKGSY